MCWHVGMTVDMSLLLDPHAQALKTYIKSSKMLLEFVNVA